MTPVWIAELVHINRSTGVGEILDIINLWSNHTTKCHCYHLALAWMDKVWTQLLEQPVVDTMISCHITGAHPAKPAATPPSPLACGGVVLVQLLPCEDVGKMLYHSAVVA